MDQQMLTQFQSINLSEMERVGLMNRTDTKYLLSQHTLSNVLPSLIDAYFILEVDGERNSRYQTLYFDTPQFSHYLEHQNGKRHRFKIREREYLESHLAFLEVKEKSNKGRTTKNRIRLNEIVPELSESSKVFVSEMSNNSQILEPKLWNTFKRITLVNKQANERVTIDTDISFYFGDMWASLEGLAIIEVKQGGMSRHSDVISHLKQRLVRTDGISKYCLGVAMLYPKVKSNTFKEKLLRIRKIIHHG
jgi:hypothetical protein